MKTYQTQFPQNTIMNQANKGEIFGDIWGSYGIDLTSNIGKVRVSPRLVTHTTSDNQASISSPIAFVRNMGDTNIGDAYFAINHQRVMKLAVANIEATLFGVDFLANSPTTTLSRLYSDADDWNGGLMVSTLTDVMRLSGGVWTTWWTGTLGQVALTTGVPHPVRRGFNNLFLVADYTTTSGAVIYAVNISNVIVTLTFGKEYEIMWIRSSNTQYWIGARHKFGGMGKVFTWDGSSVSFIQDYKIGSDITFAGVIKDEVCYTVNGVGQLLAFNGGGFSEVARFPIASDKVNVLNEGFTTYPVNVNRNGMQLIDNNIHILISAGLNSTNYTFLENMVSGIWEYTPQTGLYHKYGISKGNASDVVDFGSPLLRQPGALFPLNTVNKFFVGSQLYKDGSTTEIGVIDYISSDAKKKMGYLITPRVYAKEADEMYQKMFLIFEKLRQSGDFIALKYRTIASPIAVFSSTGTWTSTTTFTTTATEFSGVSVGNEIEVLSGEGSGLSATITAISVNAGTYTVTIDYTLTGASGTFNFRTSNWTKIDTVTDLVRTYKDFGLGIPSNWIQFKIVLYGIGSTTASLANSPELEKLILLSGVQIPIS